VFRRSGSERIRREKNNYKAVTYAVVLVFGEEHVGEREKKAPSQFRSKYGQIIEDTTTSPPLPASAARCACCTDSPLNRNIHLQAKRS
jgi:hypothetical protein